MARDKQKQQGFFKNNKKIKDNLNLLDKSLNSLYYDTYQNQKDNLDDSDKVRNDIEQSIDDIMGTSYSNTSIGNMTKMLSKLQLAKAEGNRELKDAIKMFEDPLLMNNILATQANNKWIRDLDAEIDMVLKYMPKLNEALNAKRDSVLSADHFSKDFVNFHNILSQNKQELFNKRMEEIKKVYKLPTNFEQWYDDTQKYGESFIYIVPYSAAFSRLLKNKSVSQFQAAAESSEINILTEGVLDQNVFGDDIDKTISGFLSDEIFNGKSLSVTLNKSGVLLSAADGLKRASETIQENSIRSLRESFITEMTGKISEASGNVLASQLIPNELEMPKGLEDERGASEGIFSANGNIRSDGDPKITVPGCIVKKLDRANVIPIYIEDICLGYYYLEFKSNDITYDDPNYLEFAAGINTVAGGGIMQRSVEKQTQDNRNKVVNYIAKQLSDVIDSNFINANQDLRRELFMILKHNDVFNAINGTMVANINISFLPSEDVIHMKFQQDPVTHRGISDLNMSLFPAKLYSCLYITHVLGTLTRGQDKRVYYVKQNVETNISKTLLNVLNQIKKGNFGARQMENLSSILNITGRFNDYIIPMSQSGDTPIQFEVMQGQQFDYQTELMQSLEEMAVNQTDVPLELIQSRQSLDYAIQATMSNSKFMRNVYKRQDMVQDLYSDIASKIYNYEYLEMETIEMTLPAPAFLNMTNGQQLIQGTQQYVQSLVDIKAADSADDVKAELTKITLDYYLASHINLSQFERFKTQAEINVEKKKSKYDQDQNA